MKLPPIVRDLALWLVVLGIGVWLSWHVEGPTRGATYTDAVAAIAGGKVKEVHVGAQELRLVLKEPKTDAMVVARVPNMDERPLLEAMEKEGVVVIGEPERSNAWLWLSALPLLAIPLALMVTGAGRGPRGAISFGKSKPRIVDKSNQSPTTFADVAGAEEAKAELVELVRFLKEPERFRAVGARIPKGVLLVGPPGTGKTLLARAVAGESGVPFFSLSGSEFVEMFVGVGASRVRDLFEQAKSRAPCIIFIDELDAMGKARSGAHGFAANEEREQTLNQLLVEMDGFDASAGVVILGATNRPEILDRALLRAGRFDRQVVVDGPDARGRRAILEVHARKIAIAPDVDFEVVAQRTAGMVGADLANVVNEAALASVRRDAKVVEARDFEEAVDRIRLGLRKEGRVLTPDEKHRVAVHESGHAVVALSVEHADPVDRVTIIPRSIGALGATLQLPTTDRYLLTREELCDRMAILFGGRVAEELVCGNASTGASDDLDRATEIARSMVCKFGMSALGPMTAEIPRNDVAGVILAETTRGRIDAEVSALLEGAHARARSLLEAKRWLLDATARELLARETLQREDLARLSAAGPS